MSAKIKICVAELGGCWIDDHGKCQHCGAQYMKKNEYSDDFEIGLIIGDAMTARHDNARTPDEKRIALDWTQKVVAFLHSVRIQRDSEKAAAKLLRNPCNFDLLVDAFESSKETTTRGKLDDALKALART